MGASRTRVERVTVAGTFCRSRMCPIVECKNATLSAPAEQILLGDPLRIVTGQFNVRVKFSRPLMSQMQCPGCGASAVRQSSGRTPVERVRKLFTSKRPHRCRKCGWNGWTEVSRGSRHGHTWTVEREPPDLKAVDALLVSDSSGGESPAPTRSDQRMKRR